MDYPTVTNYQPGDGARKVDHSIQGVLTTVGAVTIYRLTILGRITATEKYCFYDPANNPVGSSNIEGISLSEVVATGAVDKPVSVMREGEVDKAQIRIHGSAVGVGITAAIIDELQKLGIRVVSYTECGAYDNQ